MYGGGVSYADDLRADVDSLTRRATEAREPDQIDELLNELTSLHELVGECRDRVLVATETLVFRALKAGVAPAELIGRPYAKPTVYKYAKIAGVGLRRGRPPKRRPLD